MYPPRLEKIVGLMESLSEEEKRENLIAYADESKKFAPSEGEQFDLTILPARMGRD